MRNALRSFAIALATVVGAASAQQAADRSERIEVTGSRIAAPEVESASPVAVIRAEDLRAEGYSSLELILNNLPQLVGGQGNRISNGATGTAEANLRGLLGERTLVLVNGRRLPLGSPLLLTADLNQVPPHLINRVEILTGGASAVYGSDAVAGVVNIILEDRFKGVRGEVAYDFYNHRQQSSLVPPLLRERGFAVPGDKERDGETFSSNLTLGGSFANDKGSAVASFRYSRAEALLQSERDYSGCALTDGGGRPVCGGSITTYPTRLFDFGPLGTGTLRRWTIDATTGRVRPPTAADLYNFNPWNYYQRPGERHGFNAQAGYQLSTRARVYAETGYHDDHTIAQTAPSGAFNTQAEIRYENPLLTSDWRSRLAFVNPDGITIGTGPGTVANVTIQRRNVEGGPRQDDLRHTSFRQVVGVKGEAFGPWDYDAYVQIARVNFQESFRNDFSTVRLQRALDVVTDPTTGLPVCASALSGVDPLCVPYNVWVVNGITPEALAYVQVPASMKGSTRQQIVAANVTGDLGHYGIRFPRAASSVEVAFGVERRTDRVELDPSAEYLSGELSGQTSATPPLRGRVRVNDIYGEARIPVLPALAFSGSYRHSDYSNGRKTDTFGVGFNAAPMRGVRLRGSLQRAARAPNVSELFAAQVDSPWFMEGGDPCAGPAPARSLEECRRSGVTPAQYGNIRSQEGFYLSISGGNPDLAPETATTATAGIAFAPSRDVSLTADYFDIRVDDFITAGDAATLLVRCLDTGDPKFCDLIRRHPVLGTLWLAPGHVIATNQNIGRVHVSGADLSASIAHRWRRHRVSVAALGTYLQRFSIEPFRGAIAHQCAGIFAGFCFEARPKWRHRVRLSWHPPVNAEAFLSWRYLHSVRHYQVGAPIGMLPSRSYFDVGGAWSPAKGWTVRATVNNVADRDPPVFVGSGSFTMNGNTFVHTYDALGRHVAVSISVSF